MKKITNKTKSMQLVETKFGEDVEEILRRMFVDEHLSQIEIANQLNISYATVYKWLRLAGVRSRKLDVS